MNQFLNVQLNKKGKVMKSTESYRRIGLSLLFMFIIRKWTSFYAIKGIVSSKVSVHLEILTSHFFI